MGATEKLRKVMALPEVVQNVELAEKLKNIYEDYNELVDKNYKLTQKLENMEKISSIKKLAKKIVDIIFSTIFILDWKMIE